MAVHYCLKYGAPVAWDSPTYHLHADTCCCPPPLWSLPHPIPSPQAAIAQRDAAEAALEADAADAMGGSDNLADAAKDVAGELQDKASGVYDQAKQRVLGKRRKEKQEL